MDLSGGLPKGRVSRKLPTPFSRPSISVQGGENRVVKAWQWCWPVDLHDGDIIAEHGIILSIERKTARSVERGTVYYLVRVGIPEGPSLILDDAQQVWAFSHVKEE